MIKIRYQTKHIQRNIPKTTLVSAVCCLCNAEFFSQLCLIQFCIFA